MWADITVFDPATVIDHATYDAPATLPEGIRFVTVNGQVALADGKPTGARAGQALYRSPNMPTRPMQPMSGARGIAGKAVAVKGDAGGELVLTVDLSHPAGAAAAKGMLEIKRKSGERVLAMQSFGILQTAKGWASITGLAQLAGGRSAAVTVIVDDGQPGAPAKQVRVVAAGDGIALSGWAAVGAVQLR
jgi:hypothetical protein